jgi:DNA helicase-2/ATP-dependent DNA helicase PcrA
MSDLLLELNEKQREVVMYNEGPSLVVAGAGSGKTRVLTCKIAYLLQQGMPPYAILALTFTNKAAREMKERIARIVGEELASQLWMGTFHSVFARILRTEADKLGFTSGFTIYDTTDSRSLVASIIRDMELDAKTVKKEGVAACISAAKNRLVTPEMFLTSRGIKLPDGVEPETMHRIYKVYQERCKLADAMDFDDLLFYTHILFDTYPEVAARYERRFQYVLVDEYQDTNYAQHAIVWQLTQNVQRLCVVGDDAQSIYGFRGAEIDNILKFTTRYKSAKTFKLECNYRSTKKIVQAANSLIAHNEHRIPKDVFTHNDEGKPLSLYAASNDKDEAFYVMKRIRTLHVRDGVPYSEMAVLYRTHSQSRVFEETFRQRDIPYRIYGGLSFYQRMEVKDLIAYFRLAVNPNDEEAFKRAVNTPKRGIGDTSVRGLMETAFRHGCSVWQVLSNPADYEVKNTLVRKITPFYTMIERFRALAQEENAYDVACIILKESGLQDEYKGDAVPENEARRENIQELLNAMGAFVANRMAADASARLSDYLQEVSLLTDVQDDETDLNKVTMMTVHSAKGLEFGYVFIVGIEEDLFPSYRAQESLRAIEEERRLFYVAITRAEKECSLSFTRQRFLFGDYNACRPSRFLRELDVSCIKKVTARDFDEPTSARPRPSTPVRNTPERPLVPPTLRAVRKRDTSSEILTTATVRRSSGDVLHISVGNTVEHDRFGRGVVKEILNDGGAYKAVIEFARVGSKTMLLQLARITVVN